MPHFFLFECFIYYNFSYNRYPQIELRCVYGLGVQFNYCNKNIVKHIKEEYHFQI